MQYLHIYLLVTVAIFCLFGIIAYLKTGEKTVLDAGTKNFIEKYIDKKALELEQSRTNISIQTYLVMKGATPAALAVMAYFITDNRSMMLIFIVLGFLIPDMFLTIKKKQHDRDFSSRYVRALAQMASALHSGMTVEQSVEAVIDCELLHDEVRDDFKRLSAQMKLGTPITKVFFDYAAYTGNPDVYDTAVAISIMMDVGGDAGIAIQKIQKNIEERLIYRKKRDSMMTESRLIVIVGDAIPLIFLAFIYITMPEVVSFYTSGTSHLLILLVVIIMLAVGSIISHKMLSDKVDVS